MNNRKSLIPALILGLSIVLLAGPASAWEFTMDGVYTWHYEVRGQMGSSGFFGQYDVAQSPGAAAAGNAGPPASFTPIWASYIGAYAPLNFYTGGYHIGNMNAGAAGSPVVFGGYGNAYGGQAAAIAGGEQIVSGSDACWNVMYMSTNMQIAMNKALRIRGNYYIGSWGNTYNGTDYNSANSAAAPGVMVGSGALQQDAPGVQRSFSPGYWRTLWLTAQLPWGEIAVGKRPSSWGMGLVYNGEDNRHSDSLSLTVPYGPLRIQMSFYPARRGYATDDYYNGYAGSTLPIFYNERVDKNNTRVFDMTIPNVTYRSGVIDTGFYLNWVFRHRGGESVIPLTNDATGNRGTQARDYKEQYGGVYFKYNNGRFFLNAEYGFDRIIDVRSGNRGVGISGASGQPSTLIADPIYTNWDGGVVETGMLCGPAKLALLGSWMTGDDYRYGQTQAGFQRVAISLGHQNDQWSNTGIFRPYSYLMIYGYGLGTSFARDTGNGFVQDATVYAARLDYAVAANLNIYGSFTWAEKFSHSGEMWGCLIPDPNVGAPSAPLQGKVLYMRSPSGGSTFASLTRIPTIPDGALGYEFDAGFDWKLLEGLTARTTLGYWVPGNWWKYACVDKNISNWALPGSGTSANNWNTNPSKSIDPVWGMEFKLEGSF